MVDVTKFSLKILNIAVVIGTIIIFLFDIFSLDFEPWHHRVSTDCRERAFHETRRTTDCVSAYYDRWAKETRIYGGIASFFMILYVIFTLLIFVFVCTGLINVAGRWCVLDAFLSWLCKLINACLWIGPLLREDTFPWHGYHLKCVNIVLFTPILIAIVWVRSFAVVKDEKDKEESDSDDEAPTKAHADFYGEAQPPENQAHSPHVKKTPLE